MTKRAKIKLFMVVGIILIAALVVFVFPLVQNTMFGTNYFTAEYGSAQAVADYTDRVAFTLSCSLNDLPKVAYTPTISYSLSNVEARSDSSQLKLPDTQINMLQLDTNFPAKVSGTYDLIENASSSYVYAQTYQQDGFTVNCKATKGYESGIRINPGESPARFTPAHAVYITCSLEGQAQPCATGDCRLKVPCGQFTVDIYKKGFSAPQPQTSPATQTQGSTQTEASSSSASMTPQQSVTGSTSESQVETAKPNIVLMIMGISAVVLLAVVTYVAMNRRR